MADFDMTTIPALAAQRLDAVAADCQQRGQSMFEQALADQRALLSSLAKPAPSLMDATATRVESLAATPPPRKDTGGGAAADASEAPPATDTPAAGDAPPSGETTEQEA